MNPVNNFQSIWNCIIIPLADSIQNQIDETFKKETNAHLCNLNSPELRRKAEGYYKQKRRALKDLFYGKDYEDNLENPRYMDFHKLASILCRTLMEFKVFVFDDEVCMSLAENKSEKDTDWLVKNALVNYRMAFYASVVFLYYSMLFKYDKKNQHELYDALKKQGNLILYNDEISTDNTNSDKMHESFENCVVLDLAKRDIENKSFDLLMYSTILYQLEEYNEFILKTNILKNQ